MKKNIFIILVFLGVNLSAQQLINFSQTLENKYLLNPAAAGFNDRMPLFLGYKTTWNGLDDAPRMQYLTYHMKLDKDLGGVGAKIFNYSTGNISKTGLNVSYAYHLKIDKEYSLSIGLSGAIYQMSLRTDKLRKEVSDDILINNAVQDDIVPDANFGVLFYSDKLFVGLSSMQLFGKRVDMFNKNLDFKQVRHYFFNAGYKVHVAPKWDIEPSVLVKYVESGFGQWDLSVKTLYMDFAWITLGYRSDFEMAPNDVFIGCGIQYNRMKFGYAYDYTLSDIGKVTNGSHELIFTYYFGKHIKRSKW